IRVNAALICNDGSLIHQWALAGAGIALKAFWDIKHDLASGNLVTVLDDYVLSAYVGDEQTVGLQMVYPNRKYLPRQVAGFIDYFARYLKDSSMQ
ncbi:MAG: LysR family transcriptional regulator, partial [Leptolyngbya sp. SIO3F4]|nr:LysR family transcriptional regulator [Leptolyngbya sp. SIO3F4]